jgi:D-alanine-D-alanine ligase
MIGGQEKPWLLEVNTTPGMTESSLLPKAAAQAGMTFEELVWEILSQAKIA